MQLGHAAGHCRISEQAGGDVAECTLARQSGVSVCEGEDLRDEEPSRLSQEPDLTTRPDVRKEDDL